MYDANGKVTGTCYIEGYSIPSGRRGERRDTVPAQYYIYFRDEAGTRYRVDLRDFFKNKRGIFTAKRRAALKATKPSAVSILDGRPTLTDLFAWLERAQSWLEDKPKGRRPEVEQPSGIANIAETKTAKPKRPTGAKATCQVCKKLKPKTAFRKGLKGETCKTCERT